MTRILLSDHRVDVNCNDKGGRTPLHMAANVEVAQLLLVNEKVDVNAKDKDNATALHFAAERDLHEILGLILAHPRLNSVNCVDDEGEAPVMTALLSKSFKCLRKLLAHPTVNLDITDRKGNGLKKVAR